MGASLAQAYMSLQGHISDCRNNCTDTGFKMAEGRRVNIYTASQDAFAMAHVHGQVYKKRSLLTSEGTTIKNKHEIVQLLEAIWLPTELFIISKRQKLPNSR